MGNVAGSPNDPLFFNHHTMIDCLFERWLEDHDQASYPNQPVSSAFAGHGPQDCVVPFFPLYTHQDMFKRSTELGYTCGLSLDPAGPSTQPCKRNGDCPQNTTPSSNSQTTTPTNGVGQNGVNSAVLNTMSLLVICIIALMC